MLVINQSCHGKNTHRFIIGLALHFYSFFFYHPPFASLNLSASTILKTHKRDTHTPYSTHRQTLCPALTCLLLFNCKGVFTMTAIKSLEVTKSLYYQFPAENVSGLARQISLPCSKCCNHSIPKPLQVLHFMFYVYYMVRHKIPFHFLMKRNTCFLPIRHDYTIMIIIIIILYKKKIFK